jgi:amino acid adenylation domain-containing protein
VVGTKIPDRAQDSIGDRLTRVAARAPGRIAILGPEAELSYAQLDAAATAIAHRILASGTTLPASVCLLFESKLAAITAIFGVSRSGGAYVPLDAGDPDERLRFILRDSEPVALLTESNLLERARALVPAGCVLIDIERLASEGSNGDLPVVTGDMAANVYYTSGSTGVPKGVCQTHRNVLFFADAYAKTLRIGENDRVSLLYTLSFSASMMDIFGALFNGATLCPYDVRRSGVASLAHWLDRERITVLHAVPTVFRGLLSGLAPQRTLGHLRAIDLGGETVFDSDVELFRRHTQETCILVNQLAATEANVIAQHVVEHRGPRPADGIVPVGRRPRGLSVRIRRGDGSEAEADEVGEIVVSSAHVSPGYWRRPELNAVAFSTDPIEPGGRSYFTGDLGRIDQEGTLHFLGRRASRIKIRGQSIDLSEVEAALAACPGVIKSAVVAASDAPHLEPSKLIAYLVVGEPAERNPLLMHRHVAARLPSYMLPTAFVFLDALPLTATGKIDRNALAAMKPPPIDQLRAVDSPRDALERAVAGLFEQLLQQTPIGRDDDFFMLGGDSLRGAQLLHEISVVFDVTIPVNALFDDAGTVASMAARITAERARSASRTSAPTIPRRAAQAVVPLASTQARIWFLQRLEPGACAYNEARLWRIDGLLDLDALRAALSAVTARQAMLRTRFVTVAAEPRQVIDPDPVVDLEVVDLAGAAEDDERRLALAVRTHVARPFDLALATPLRWTLFRLGSERFALLRVWHHILGDALSARVLQYELSEAYAAARAGRDLALPALPIDYADYAVWQAGKERAATLEPQLAFWKRRLANLPVLALPPDFRRPPTQSFRGGVVTTALPQEAAAALKALGRRQGASAFVTFLAAFSALLSRLSGDTDLAIGTLVAGRSLPELNPLVGFFANTVVFRADLAGSPSGEELVARTRDGVRDALQHQDVAFKDVVDALGTQRDPSRNPLFQVAFSLRESDAVDLHFEGAEVRRIETGVESAKFDLTLTLVESPERVDARWEYCADLFELTTIERMSRQYALLIEAMAAQPAQRVETLPLMDDATRERIVGAASRTSVAYPAALTIAERFTEQARATPGSRAIGSLDYAGLDAAANRLARELRTLGVVAGAIVAVARRASVDTAVAWLAVLKAGAAYLPIDPDLPRERVAFMIADARVAHIIADDKLAGLCACPGVYVIQPERDAQRIAAHAAEALDCASRPGDAAYVMYTSGSTGSPKGVLIPHRAVLRLVCGTDCAQLGPDDTVAQIANPAFDASTFEFWGALLNGARIVPIAKSTAIAPRALAATIANEGVTALFLTTALFHAVARDAPDAFRDCRYVLFGGEAAEPRWVAEVLRAGPPRHLINGYGPTETTTFATWHEVRDAAPNANTIPIGRPLANTEVFVLRPDFDPVAPGEPGEIYIGGPGLAIGYLNAPEHLAQRFAEHRVAHLPPRRLYQSGDRARLRDDGTIEFLGRRDRQIKIRGHRIELEEIEGAIATLPQVRATAVVVRGDTAETRQVVAYVVRAEASGPLPANLWGDLRTRLPEYMLPASIVWLSALPLNASGKIDRRALPLVAEIGAQLPGTRVAPRDMLEHVLVRIWESLLNIGGIGVFDRFFEIGGNSLLAARLVDEIERETGIAAPLAALFEDDTIAGLGRVLREGHAELGVPTVTINDGGTLPPFVFLHGDLSGGGFYSRSLAHALGPDQPVVVVHPHGLDALPIPESIEAMAADRIRSLRALRPHGPYVVGGYCNGAFVAFEIARQLTDQGEHVPAVVLIEARAPIGARGPDQFAAGAFYATFNQGGGFGILAPHDARLGYARAIERYVGGPYAGHLVIVRSRTLDDARPELGWARLAHSAEIHVLPGDHVTLVTRYVGELALVTRAAIDRVHERAAKGLRFASHAPSPVPDPNGPATARVGAGGTRSVSARAVDDAPERA